MKIADAVKGPIFDVSGSEDPPAAAPSASQVRQSRAPEASRAANQMASDEPGPIHWNESPVTNLKTGASLRLSRGDDPTKEAHMTKIILAAAAAAALLTTTPLVVGSTPAQAQSVEVGPGGIRVDPDRRDRRDYYRDRRDYRGGRRCRTEYTTRESPSGRVVRERRTVCRD